jgi:hypothetical protein
MRFAETVPRHDEYGHRYVTGTCDSWNQANRIKRIDPAENAVAFTSAPDTDRIGSRSISPKLVELYPDAVHPPLNGLLHRRPPELE